ncbi:MAG: DUF3878 family protein [Eubacteriales bacterium]|nr:DUF3878 family protein [Eubacteriales bacterium]
MSEINHMKDRNPISRAELHELLEQIVLWDAFEICQGQKDEKGHPSIYIPYLMNDAVEYYIELTNASVDGNLNGKKENLEIIRIEDHVPLGFRVHSVDDENDFTNDTIIWYHSAYLHLHCYQYHLIGHDWRKTKGQEFHRRLVNLICVIHDKRTYLGNLACNELEDLLADLAEFPPFLYYTPINESILDWYPDSVEGIDAAKEFAQKDSLLFSQICDYEEKYYKNEIDESVVEELASVLLEEEHNDFWLQIHNAITEASHTYEERCYSDEENVYLIKQRNEIESYYKEKGYDGSYPYMTYSDDPLSKPIHEIYFAEQHPFTVLEWEDYSYAFYEIHVDHGRLSECKWVKN